MTSKNTEKFDNYFPLSFYLVKKLSSACSEDTFTSIMNQPHSVIHIIFQIDYMIAGNVISIQNDEPLAHATY